jgi:hypothetical protein
LQDKLVSRLLSENHAYASLAVCMHQSCCRIFFTNLLQTNYKSTEFLQTECKPLANKMGLLSSIILIFIQFFNKPTKKFALLCFFLVKQISILVSVVKKTFFLFWEGCTTHLSSSKSFCLKDSERRQCSTKPRFWGLCRFFQYLITHDIFQRFLKFSRRSRNFYSLHSTKKKQLKKDNINLRYS